MRPLIAVSAGLRDPESARASPPRSTCSSRAPPEVLTIQGQGAPAPSSGDDDSDDGDDGGRVCEARRCFRRPRRRASYCPATARSRRSRCASSDRGSRAPHRVARPRTTSASTSVRSRCVRRWRASGASANCGHQGLFGSQSMGEAAVVLAESDALDFAIDLDAASLRIDLADAEATLRSSLRFTSTTSSLALPRPRTRRQARPRREPSGSSRPTPASPSTSGGWVRPAWRSSPGR